MNQRPLLLAYWQEAVAQSVQSNMAVLDRGQGLKCRELPDKMTFIFPKDNRENQPVQFEVIWKTETTQSEPILLDRQKVEEYLEDRTEDELLLSLTVTTVTPPHPGIGP